MCYTEQFEEAFESVWHEWRVCHVQSWEEDEDLRRLCRSFWNAAGPEKNKEIAELKQQATEAYRTVSERQPKDQRPPAGVRTMPGEFEVERLKERIVELESTMDVAIANLPTHVAVCHCRLCCIRAILVAERRKDAEG